LVLFAYQGWETPFAVCRHWMSHWTGL
jgi:hypothetical protein